MTAATSWKFLTEATVTRPLKFRHQHCNCSCHRGDLFCSTSGSPGCDGDGDGDGDADDGGIGKHGRVRELKPVGPSFALETGEEDLSSDGTENDNGVGAMPPS